jgi:hypothetical protein
MKKTVLTFGLISGAIMEAMMIVTLSFIDKIGFDRGVIVGYTTIILGFMLVFFGIRSYRENVGRGRITFARAFAVGILITVIASAFYVVAWEIVYFKFMPDFGDKYASYEIQKVKTAGASQQTIEAKVKEMKELKAMLDNPFLNAAMTFTEPFPVGLIITLISSAILRTRRRTTTADEPQPA